MMWMSKARAEALTSKGKHKGKSLPRTCDGIMKECTKELWHCLGLANGSKQPLCILVWAAI